MGLGEGLEIESIANGQRLNESHPWDETAIKIQNGGDTEGFQVGKPEHSTCQQARPQSPWGSTLVLDLAPCSSCLTFDPHPEMLLVIKQ